MHKLQEKLLNIIERKEGEIVYRDERREAMTKLGYFAGTDGTPIVKRDKPPMRNR